MSLIAHLIIFSLLNLLLLSNFVFCTLFSTFLLLGSLFSGSSSLASRFLFQCCFFGSLLSLLSSSGCSLLINTCSWCWLSLSASRSLTLQRKSVFRCWLPSPIRGSSQISRTLVLCRKFDSNLRSSCFCRNRCGDRGKHWDWRFNSTLWFSVHLFYLFFPLLNLLLLFNVIFCTLLSIFLLLLSLCSTSSSDLLSSRRLCSPLLLPDCLSLKQ